jgi:hypothetical protein
VDVPVLGADALEGRLAVGAVEAVEEHPGALAAAKPGSLVVIVLLGMLWRWWWRVPVVVVEVVG